MNSSQLHDTGFATSPSTENRHFARSTAGAPEASSTGHFKVRDCPGGTRSSRRVSSLIIAPSGASAGVRTCLSWVLEESIPNIELDDARYLQCSGSPWFRSLQRLQTIHVRLRKFKPACGILNSIQVVLERSLGSAAGCYVTQRWMENSIVRHDDNRFRQIRANPIAPVQPGKLVVRSGCQDSIHRVIGRRNQGGQWPCDDIEAVQACDLNMLWRVMRLSQDVQVNERPIEEDGNLSRLICVDRFHPPILRVCGT